MEFPVTRLRRLRRSDSLRALVRETHLEPGALVLPLFLCPGEGIRKEIGSMPGVFNLSVDEAVKEAEAAAALGISRERARQLEVRALGRLRHLPELAELA